MGLVSTTGRPLVVQKLSFSKVVLVKFKENKSLDSITDLNVYFCLRPSAKDQLISIVIAITGVRFFLFFALDFVS